MKNRDIKKLFKWKIWKKGTACLLVFSVLLQTVTVSAQGIAKGPPIDMQLIQQLQEAKMPMQSDVSEEGQIVQSSGEQSELTENGQTDQPSGNQSGSMENGQTGQPSGDQSGSMENGQTDQPSGDQSGSAENGQAVQPSGDQSGSAENGQTDPSSDQQSEDADLYENGIIKIYNIEQLQAIGTGSSVRMNDTEKELFGTGEEVVDGGNAVTYASDADYMLMNEIPLTAKTMWTLPEGFTGTFAEAPKEDAPLYDKESDTVYVYNNYQLLLIASENSAEEPIMSYDMIPEKVGIGQLLYKDGTLADESAEAAQEYLTYSKEHNYVLSPSFTEQMPELKAEKIKKEATVQADAGQLGGREYLGQVYTKVEGEPYILIGNEWQLRAIGQDAKPKEKGNQYMQVTPMLYVKSIVDLPWPWDDKITYTPYYPGDADFNLKQGEALGESGIEQKDFIYFSEANTNKTEGLMNIEYDKEGLVGFLLGPLGELLGDILHALLGPLFDIPILGDLLAGLIGERTDDIVIVDKEFNQNNVQSYPSLSEASNELKSLKYSLDANYIIFRDIDLLQGEYSDGKEDDWTPLHFSGKMEGRLNMQEGSVPTISNIQVNQTGELDIQKDSGIGFFGTISNEMKKSGNGGFESAGKAGVKNLHLDQVTVNNQSVTVNNDPKSLVEGLLEVLGGLLGGILDLISGILEGLVPVIGNLKLGDVIKDLLTLKQSSPDMFATGSFAGRIVGDVSVENCTVTNASVTNVKGMTGGFVGYTSGEATYILGNVTAGVVELLSTLLNILPGVGLGDLITILLKNDVPLGQLLPNGYYKPLIQNSSVSLSEGSIGTTGTGKETVNYNGGFVGSQTGTDINNCSVTGLNQVVADIGAGGFAGIEKDAQVKGLLSDLGAEIKTFDIRSTQRNCHVDASDLSVTATDSYAGGFNGVMANSSSIESNVSGVKLVKANQYAGGFAGRATLGYGMAVGSNDEQNDTLLQSVSKLLEQLLASGNEEELGVLLSLSGAQPSEIKGSSVSGTNFSVQAAADYAGGLIGQGDGVQITSSGTEKNTIQGVSFVKANNYAGGISGAVTVADAVGVLNDTLGIGSYLSFTVSNVDLGGNDLQIEASNKYASGGAGLMLGGTAEQIKIEGIQSVTAGNYAAGFAGRAGTGSLAKEGGLDLLGLGLIKVDSLLSLVDGVATKVSNVSVSGTENGAVIKASGQVEITEGESILAGGFISEAEGVQIADSHVTNLKAVYAEAAKDNKEGYAGGFVGRSHTGGLAGLAQEDKDGALKLPGIVNVSGLLDLVPYLIPQYTNTTVTFCSANEEPQVKADYAGGFFGEMQSGKVDNSTRTEAYAVYGLEKVKGESHAGGFAGEMKTGGVAEVGKVELIGLDIANSISAVQTFVPIIRNSDITGFQSGMTVKATGIPVKDSTLKIEKVGYAGGYVGHMVGGQIWGNWSEKANTYSATDAVPDPNNKRCFVANLRKVEGTKAIGGFAGQIDPASAANLDTASSEGLLGGLLQYLIGTPGDLARLLDATISTVRGADVKAWDDWGIIVNGSYTNDSDHTAYAKAAGGFAGEINGAVIGKQDDPNSGLHVVNIRSVTGGEYAGGFLGLADVSAILQVSNGNTSILSALLTLGGTSVLDTFRSYVYHSDVSGSAEAGLEVQARDSKKSEYVNDPVYSGSAGGFGGALLNGSVKDSKVTNLRKVNGMNYTGGFIGHLGKSGTVDLDNLGALGDLLSAGAGVMDVFGSHVDRCSVEGVNEGFTVHSNNTIDQKNKSEIAGGFTGYADLGRLSENKVTGLKQVTSGQIAGGFAGKTTFAYLANINLDSELVKGLVTVVNQILKALWLDELQKGQVIKIDLGIIEIDALYDGKLVSLNLLGLDIKVGLAEDKSLATIYIGDSKIEINCSESGTIDEESLKNEINISLIKANRTKIDKCTVTGIADGYDVYGGGAGNNANGTGQYGIAGGFVGWNNEGLLENNNMFFADVIRGAKDLTGPFTGKSSLNSNWEFNDVKGIEGNENYYRIYRNGDTAYEKLFGKSGKELQHNYETSDAWKNVYTIRHMTKDKVVKFTDLKDAMMSGSAGQIPVNVYQEDGAMAVLMNNTASSPTEPGGNEEAPDVQDPCKDLIELRLKKVWKRDEEKDRPNEVIFNITRSYEKDGKPVVDTNFNKEVILTKKDAQTSDIWEKVLTGAEYTAYHVGTDGKKYYYTYHVSEMKVDGYTTEITYKGDRQYSITVTNTKNWFDSLLPETGGMGKALLYTLGVLLLCLVTATEYRKRKSTRSQSSYK